MALDEMKLLLTVAAAAATLSLGGCYTQLGTVQSDEVAEEVGDSLVASPTEDYDDEDYDDARYRFFVSVGYPYSSFGLAYGYWDPWFWGAPGYWYPYYGPYVGWYSPVWYYPPPIAYYPPYYDPWYGGNPGYAPYPGSVTRRAVGTTRSYGMTRTGIGGTRSGGTVGGLAGSAYRPATRTPSAAIDRSGTRERPPASRTPQPTTTGRRGGGTRSGESVTPRPSSVPGKRTPASVDRPKEQSGERSKSSSPDVKRESPSRQPGRSSEGSRPRSYSGGSSHSAAPAARPSYSPRASSPSPSGRSATASRGSGRR